MIIKWKSYISSYFFYSWTLELLTDTLNSPENISSLKKCWAFVWWILSLKDTFNVISESNSAEIKCLRSNHGWWQSNGKSQLSQQFFYFWYVAYYFYVVQKIVLLYSVRNLDCTLLAYLKLIFDPWFLFYT